MGIIVCNRHCDQDVSQYGGRMICCDLIKRTPCTCPICQLQATSNPYAIHGESFDIRKTRYFYGEATLQPWIDPDTGMPGYKRVLGMYRIPLFEFTTDPRNPITFVTMEGTSFRPYYHFRTDGGSIPRFLWAVPFIHLGAWDFPRAYPFHDCAFTYGGLYVQDGTQWIFKLIPRTRLNKLLGQMIRADGGTTVDECTVEWGLALGSKFCWDEIKQASNRQRDGIVVTGELT